MLAMSTNPLPPDLQLALERLFELFSGYVAAGNAKERRELHAQILDLFSRLGVVSDSALVRRAAEIFDRIKQERAPSQLREATLANQARDFVSSQLRLFERLPNAPALSTGARQLLRIPVAESAEFTFRFDPEEASISLNRVLSTLSGPPVSRAEGTAEIRTSIAVIRAFRKNYCRIPPFCSGGEEP
jgi:hypothetical protein